MRGQDPRTYGQLIARGTVRNIVPWAKTGYNGDVDVGTETLWTAGGLYVYPAAPGIQMQCISTSGNDIGGGAGVQQVRISYLTSAYTEASEVVVLTGAAAVNTVANNIFRVQTFRAVAVGGTTGAAGTISLQAVGGATTYSQIALGQTRARNSTWTVPAGKTLYVTSVVFSAGGAGAQAKTAILTTRATYDDSTATILTAGQFFMPYHEVLCEDGNFYRELEVPTRLPATVDLKVDATGLAADTVCTSVLRGYLITG